MCYIEITTQLLKLCDFQSLMNTSFQNCVLISTATILYIIYKGTWILVIQKPHNITYYIINSLFIIISAKNLAHTFDDNKIYCNKQFVKKNINLMVSYG